MVFSDTSNKRGLIQVCERYTNLGDAGITGDATLFKIFTAMVNDAYDEVLPLVFQSDGEWQFDDLNHTDFPIGTTNLVSGQRDYSFISDENGNSILEIYSIAIKKDDTTSDYEVIYPINRTIETAQGREIIENDGNLTGVAQNYDKFSNAILLDRTPDYSATAGIQFTFTRTPDYFTSSDTTQTPGIPDYFHNLLSLIASHEWLIVNKPENTTLITRLEEKIRVKKKDLEQFMARRSKDVRKKMTMRGIAFR